MIPFLPNRHRRTTPGRRPEILKSARSLHAVRIGRHRSWFDKSGRLRPWPITGIQLFAIYFPRAMLPSSNSRKSFSKSLFALYAPRSEISVTMRTRLRSGLFAPVSRRERIGRETVQVVDAAVSALLWLKQKIPNGTRRHTAPRGPMMPCTCEQDSSKALKIHWNSIVFTATEFLEQFHPEARRLRRDPDHCDLYSRSITGLHELLISTYLGGDSL